TYSNTAYALSCSSLSMILEMRLLLSFISPKTMASAGHALAQAVLISPSTGLLPSLLASNLPAFILCTQKVHFSITPLAVTVASRLSTILPTSLFMEVFSGNCLLPWHLNQLNLLAL